MVSTMTIDRNRCHRTINPMYGKKGMGWIRDPKRAAYNKVYRKTTFDVTKRCLTPLALILSAFLFVLIII